MKILIVGAAAMGKLFGFKLAKGGHEERFLERDPEVVKEINAS